jgi:2-amino-4-hydroxy-6-hydroxymethyldihydropteridine diphosphokinase
LSEPDNSLKHEVYIGLGSNIDPLTNFKHAIDKLRDTVQVKAVSKVWETPPVGTSGPNFLNAVTLIYTSLQIALLRDNILRRIESQLGRVRTMDPNSARPIDLDILIFDKHIIDNEIWTQAHIAIPLAEFIPDFTNPETGETLLEIATRLERKYTLKIRPDVIL